MIMKVVNVTRYQDFKKMKGAEKKLKLLGRYASWEQRSLPDFFVAGTQKGGTTSLYAYLAQHPNIIGSLRKEVRFFPSPVVRKKGIRWYRSHFPTVREKEKRNAITGEATPLMYDMHSPSLMREVIPDVKLVFLLRDPVKRAFSHYKHNTRRPGRENLTFGEAIRCENSRIEQDIKKSKDNIWYDDAAYRRHSYISRGLYADQIEKWYEFFPKEQMLIEESEYFYSNPQEFLRKVVAFLNLPSYEFNCKDSYNVGGYDDAISPRDRQYLEVLYKEPNNRLFELIGRRLWNR